MYLKLRVINIQASNAKILAQGEVELPENPKRFHGEYPFLIYKNKNQELKQMDFIIFRDDELAAKTLSI